MTEKPRLPKSGEELSAFFVGLLYFVVQWIWQMQNSKHEAAIPLAIALVMTIAVSGATSAHAFLLYGKLPDIRMRIVNVLLFLPFAVIGVFSLSPAREIAIRDDSALADKWWFNGTWWLILVGIGIGFLPLFLAIALRRLK